MPTCLSFASSSGQTRWCSRSYSSMASGLMRSLKAYRGMSPLGITGDRGHVPGAATRRDLFQITALAEGVHRVGRQSLGGRPFANHGAHVARERVLEAGLGFYQRAPGLEARELLVIDHGRLGEQFHRGGHGLNHGLDL